MFIGDGKQLKWKGRLIGFFTETDKGLVLVMPRKNEHLFRLYNSWGINTAILNELVTTPAIVGMRVIVDNGRKVLITTPSKWQRLGFPYRAKEFEPQMMLRECDFDMVVG